MYYTGMEMNVHDTPTRFAFLDTTGLASGNKVRKGMHWT